MIKKQKKLSYLLVSITTLYFGNYYVADKCKAMSLINDSYSICDDFDDLDDFTGIDTPVHLAVKSNDPEQLKFIIEKMDTKKMLNSKNSDGFDPLDLVFATVKDKDYDNELNNKSEIAKILVENGLYDLNKKFISSNTEFDCTIFQISFLSGLNPDVLSVMLDRGGKIDGVVKVGEKNYDIHSYLTTSIKNTKKALIEKLYDKNPKLNYVTNIILRRLKTNLNFLERLQMEKRNQEKYREELELDEMSSHNCFYRLLLEFVK